MFIRLLRRSLRNCPMMIKVDWLAAGVSLTPNGLGLVNHFENPPLQPMGSKGLIL
jgi:hypothetical protein